MKLSAKKNQSNLAVWEIQAKLQPSQPILDEYAEMVIQYGYVTLFAAAFPLAPLLAYVNNLVEIRTDSWKMLKQNHRPTYRGAKGIGRT